MELQLAPAKPEHVSELGRIAYEAFKDISDRHGFPSDWPSVAWGRMVMGMLVRSEEHYAVVALADGQPAGSNFLLLSDQVAGLGPISVEVPLQGNGVGRALMRNAVDHARDTGIERVRLMQDAFNMTSLSLYAQLGFETKEPVALLEPAPAPGDDATVRPATEPDLPAIDELCRRIYRVSRRNEVASALKGGPPPLLCQRGGRVTGYFTLGLIGHGVAETEDDLVALVGQATRQALRDSDPARCFCPLTEGSLYRKLLHAGCRAVKVMNLMALGPYEPPDGVWMPSVLY